MLSTSLKQYENHLIFVVKVNDTELLSFEFPQVYYDDLPDFLNNDAAETQDDDGFHMRLDDGIVNISILPYTDGGDHDNVELKLPLEVCRDVLSELVDILKARYFAKHGRFEDDE